MSIIKVNGKYRCSIHNVDCVSCQNSQTGKYFLKCPYSKKFECGTVSISESAAIEYEPFTPNFDEAMVAHVRKLMDEEDD